MYGELQSEEGMVMSGSDMEKMSDEELESELVRLKTVRQKALAEAAVLTRCASDAVLEIEKLEFELLVRRRMEKRLNPVRRCMFCEKIDCSEGCRT